jgi:hypothetical protein
VTVTNDPLIASTTSPVFACGYNVSCNGSTNGSASVTATGGCLPYSFAWSNGQTTATATGLGAGVHTVTVTDVNGTTTVSSITLTEPALLNGVAVSPTYNGGWNISCNGASDGAIDLSVSGGASCATYTYVWSNGATTEDISGLTAGTYSVTITDANGCSTTSSITLTEPPMLATTLIPQVYQGGWNISCNGASDGMVFANVSGGTPAYSYAWSNGATTQMVTGLTAGTYTLTITDVNNCTVSASITLTEPDALREISMAASSFNCGFNVSCNGANDGSASWTVDGGTAPYAYQWSNGQTSATATGLTAGTYTVTATDRNGCTLTGTVTLSEPALLVTTLTNSVYACGYGVSCNGASNGAVTSATTGGCAPYTYTWSNGGVGGFIHGVPAGSYSVTVTDANGCQAFATAEITEPAVLTASGTAATYACGYNISCNGASDGSINLTAAGGASCVAYTYAWSNGATTEDVSGLAAGTYTVTVTDVNGCFATSTFTLTQPAVLTKAAFNSPTHACGYNITCNGANDGVINLDMTGGCAPYAYQWSDGATTEDRTGLAAGTYSVTVTDANGCSYSDAITLTQPGPVTVTCSPNTTVYYGWSQTACATLVANGVTGGCAPYTYAWSNGATTATQTVCPTVSTDYTVTVTDANGCTATCVTRVCVIDVRCGNDLQKIEICHNPPGNAQTLCVAPSAVLQHINGHGDHLGACGSNQPCSAPLKAAAASTATPAQGHEELELEAYPNPFNTSTTLAFMTPSDLSMSLKVYNLNGQEVASVYDGLAEAGHHYAVEWKAEDVSNGVYFAKLVTSNGAVKTLKLILNR